jgi:phage gp46-like protein
MDISIIYNGKELTFDMAIRNGDLATDDGLLTAVLVSWFTDRRANDDDVVPDGTGDRRGSWQDQYPDIPGDLMGSRLWLLSREKQLPDVLQRARMYAEEALAWAPEDGIAKTVSVPAAWAGPGILVLPLDMLLVDGSRFKAVINYPLEG